MANGDMYAATRFLTSDPVLWLEADGRTVLVVTGFDVELARRSSPAGEVWALEELVAEERAAGGRTRELKLARALNAVRRAGLDAVRVPFWFPVDEAEHLRANGIGVRLDEEETIAGRRRTKSAADVELLQAVQRETELAMELARTTLRRADVADDGALHLDGAALTSERLRGIIQRHWVGRGLEPTTPIVAGGAQGADPHENGSGPLRAGEPIVCDLFPRDEQTRMYGDMTRTLCVGEPSAEAAEVHAAVEEALRAAIAACRPGISAASCTCWSATCSATAATRPRSTPRRACPARRSGSSATGWATASGSTSTSRRTPARRASASCGGRLADDRTGVYRPGVGGCRIEDHVILTADGCRNLNTMDYALIV